MEESAFGVIHKGIIFHRGARVRRARLAAQKAAEAAKASKEQKIRYGAAAGGGAAVGALASDYLNNRKK